MKKDSILDVMGKEGTVICRIPNTDKWGLFHDPIEILTAISSESIVSNIVKLEQYISKGYYAAGFISYEAAPVFDSAYKVKDIGSFPFCWFAIYDKAPEIRDFPQSDYTLPEHFLSPQITKECYENSIDKILNYISNGDIYQANNTIRAFGERIESPEKLFLSLIDSHPVPYSCYINTGDQRIVSISPELFLEKNGDKIASYPMKGTASRSPEKYIDDIIAEELSKDEKNCAENVMIVDMVRNDFGKICKAGTIKVDPLFHVDTYQTLHQMISKVYGELKDNITLFDILASTFPASSITGAPKIRAMEIIEELECSPRKIYTGSMGCFMPNMDFCLNVAIRTLICSNSNTELGIGSGIVSDSTSHSEWDECILKSEFASHKTPSFKMLETILYTYNDGFSFLDEHLARIKDSQQYFGRPYFLGKMENALSKVKIELSTCSIARARVRLLLDKDGNVATEWSELEDVGWGREKLSITLSQERVDSHNIFLYHKSTNREFYNNHYKDALNKNIDEVIFLNERSEITEGAISNIFIKKDDVWITPPVSCGLLAGIWRASMIKELNAIEKAFSIDELKSADKIIIGNSVRGLGQVCKIC